MARVERAVLDGRDLLGWVRLSCQALCDHDVKVPVLMTLTSIGFDCPHPESSITPNQNG
jgi:hypothetical protein